MAYAYPARDSTAGASSTSLDISRHSREPSRKNSGALTDVVTEFSHKLAEDDIYIKFLEERVRVEKEYIDGLRRLYDRTRSIDSLHDDAPPPQRWGKPTSRIAWAEVRDYTLREIESREAMRSAMEERVVRELVRLKDQQSKIKNSLKENIKLAESAYDEHAKHHLPKLKKSYVQKSQILEDHRRQENAIAMQARLLSTPSPTSPTTANLQEHPYAVPAGPSYTTPPRATPPLPPVSNPALISVNEIGRPTHTPSSSMSSPGKEKEKVGNRLRAGSGSGLEIKSRDVFNDIAASGKKGFSAFIQRLGGDKEKGDDASVAGGLEGEGLQRRGTTGSSNSKAQLAMRGAKVKRDADEADKAYRTAVFHLESLRLRREKMRLSAVTHLEEFNDELSKTLKTALELYMDIMHSTAVTNAQATEVAQRAVQSIDADHDMRIFRIKLHASMQDMSRAPVPYENFYVGPCRSLIFGVSLSDYDFARADGNDHGSPPTIVEKCLAAIDARGLDLEGIYRVNGRHAAVQKMIQGIEKDEALFEFEEKDDVFSIASILKQYLRELPEPVFNLPHAERVKYSKSRESHISSSFNALRGRLRRLPPIHQTTFQALIEHLGRINTNSALNKMSAKNLAVVFNSVIFGQDLVPTDGNVLAMHHEPDTVLEDLITYSELLFGADSPLQAPRVLPPDSGLSHSGVLTQDVGVDGPRPGTSRTKIRIAPDDGTLSETSARPVAERLNSGGHSSVTVTGQAEVTPVAEYGRGAARGVFTPDEDLTLQFDPSLIPAFMREGLPENIHLRPLASTDLLRHHFQLLNDLRPSPALAPSVYNAIFAHFRAAPGTYYVVVMVDKTTDELVASGTLIIERKHINGGGAAGHLEDIVISEKMQGKKLGVRLVVGLREMAVLLGCYKVILDCQDAKIPFYEKCGFYRRSAGMAYYVSSGDISHQGSPGAADVAAATVRHDSGDTLAPPLASTRAITPLSDLTDTGTTPRLDQYSHTNDAFLQDPASRDGAGSDVSSEGGVVLTIPPEAAASDGSTPGTPRTFTSASSGTGTGVTYSFPTSDASALPAWAAEGLGSKALRRTSATTSLTGSPESLGKRGGSGGGRKRVGSGLSGQGKEESEEGEELDYAARREAAGTPLPPGAAPPNLETEPERI
ncbi:hypothetical protein IAR50_005091 [Cryptococcus sp. DSM 104548]